MSNPSPTSRRTALKLGLGSVLATALATPGDAQENPPPPPGEVPADAAAPIAPPTSVDLQNFSFDALSAVMRNRAAQPYAEPSDELPQAIQDLSYDTYRNILFRRDRTVWAPDPINFHLQAYFPGFLYRVTTHLFVGDGVRFEPQNFTSADFEFLPPLDPAAYQNIELPGVAGFRLNFPLERPDLFDELVSFLGASYFRALGMGNRYGLSARGIAINTATAEEEEFPRFSAYYIVRPQPGENVIRLFAELDSPSLTGAFAFTIRPGTETIIEVVKRLYFRQPVERFGAAPLTSMYFFGENDHLEREDFRPEVHDSDGLFIERSSGERVWRPLKNPGELALSYFRETSPRSFGLLQRDRVFSHYEDIGARYDVRPSLLIEPMGDWGNGVIQLVEIPTDSEANDNIVAFWVPEERPQAGSQYEFRYRMRWGFLAEMSGNIATVADTYAGMGGNAAEVADNGFRRFEINFAGGTAANLPGDAVVEPIVDMSENVRMVFAGTNRLPGGGWRLSMEFERLDDAPAELRAKLSIMQRVISETWLYQWTGQL